uniref:Putative substrate binding protein n=1 Tax=uncultured bacterium contig00008 TaxID=1181500 RepID=A0A806KKD3_9BACT|nr:putative substrate binding protein [uncultured bacterium contig00008]
MSLLEKASMININNKKMKKSIHNPKRTDIFLIIVLLILISSPFIVNLFNKADVENKQISLYISPRFEELFGTELTEALLQEYRLQNPELLIQVSDAADGNGSSPDIFLFDEGDYGDLVTGSLLQLNTFIEHEADSAVNITEQYAIPLVSFMDLFFYNIDVLTAAGFDRPPKTRDEFLAYAKAVSGNNSELLENTTGTAISLSSRDRQAVSRDIFSWMWATGGDFWPEGDGHALQGKPVLDMRNMANDISFLRSLYNERVLAYGTFDSTGEQRLEEFADGRIAMMIASSKAIPFLRERMGDDAFGITNIPDTGTAGNYNISLSGIYAGININCEHRDIAWSFLVFLAEKAEFFCDVFKAVPGGFSNMIPGNYARDDPFYSKAWGIYETSQIVQGFSKKPGAAAYEGVFLEELQIFFLSNRTAQETLTAIQQRWDEIDNER